MHDVDSIKLNTLNHDGEAEILDFSFQGTQGGKVVTLAGRTPLVIPAEGDTRQIAKDAVRQLLTEAIEALGD